MSPDKRELRPREEKVEDLLPERIGETLGWETQGVLKQEQNESWFFKGPLYTLDYSIRKLYIGISHSVSFNLSDNRGSTYITVMGIQRVEFYKTQNAVRFHTKTGDFTVEDDGTYSGKADILFKPKIKFSQD